MFLIPPDWRACSQAANRLLMQGTRCFCCSRTTGVELAVSIDSLAVRARVTWGPWLGKISTRNGLALVLCLQISSRFVCFPGDCASWHDLPPKILIPEANFGYRPSALNRCPGRFWHGAGGLCAEGMEEPRAAECWDSGKALSIQTSGWIKITIHQQASLALPFVMWLLYEAASSLSLPGSCAEYRCSFVCNGRGSCLARSSLVA